MAMDARKQRILEAIVALYALDGEPVGSGLLASYFDMAVSSATLRNEMAALTRLGLLEQPHTSAGRVPSAKGYRYYLDHLLQGPDAMALADEDRRKVDALFDAMDAEPEKLAPAAARALADYTGCAAAASTPRADDLCIAHFEVVQVGRYSAAVLAVTSAGGVRTRVARVDTGLSRSDAAQLAQLRKSESWIKATDMGVSALMQGTVGMIHGCQVALSSKIKAASGVYNNYIVMPGALAVFLKRETEAEMQRDIVHKTTVVTVDKHYTVHLANDGKAVKLKVKETA